MNSSPGHFRVAQRMNGHRYSYALLVSRFAPTTEATLGELYIVMQQREIDFSELTFRSAILDSLSANIAVLDPTGRILAVNRSWKDFAAANRMNDADAGIGTNYLDACRAANLDPNARAALDGILGVMSGRLASFYHKYPCHSPDTVRWFALRASPLIDYPNFVVVSHENITERVLARIPARPAQKA